MFCTNNVQKETSLIVAYTKLFILNSSVILSQGKSFLGRGPQHPGITKVNCTCTSFSETTRKKILQKFIILNHFSLEFSAIIHIAHLSVKCSNHNFAKKKYTYSTSRAKNHISPARGFYNNHLFLIPWSEFLTFIYWVKTYLDFIGIKSGQNAQITRNSK